MNKGVLLWKEAKNIIPGGNQLLSKRSELFLPDQWPSYYSRAKGCEVWDLDDNHYYDFSIMGVGTCALGYADDDINREIKLAIEKGSMSTLNCFEEVALAKKLIKLHPWSDMIRFARTGGEVCTIAIRIARAYTKKSKILFCGYHGWHDWYLAANLGVSSNLDGQLLPGLKPSGVPRELKGTAIPFEYNNLSQLEEIAGRNKNEVAAIIMEPQRNFTLEKGFLEGVRRIAVKIGAVLIFDEITSGFRVNLGGIHLTLGVEPDIAMFAKALGNGYPIAAVIGRRTVMDAAQESFISSAFWTERLGFVAALATLEKMKKCNVQKWLVKYGEMVNSGWIKAAKDTGIKIKISGIMPLTHISFDYPESSALQTYYTQEMLKKGFLAGASVYTTYAYSPEIIAKYDEATMRVFKKMAAILRSGQSIIRHLEGPIKHEGFKRLT